MFLLRHIKLAKSARTTQPFNDFGKLIQYSESVLRTLRGLWQHHPTKKGRNPFGNRWRHRSCYGIATKQIDHAACPHKEVSAGRRRLLREHFLGIPGLILGSYGWDMCSRCWIADGVGPVDQHHPMLFWLNKDMRR